MTARAAESDPLSAGPWPRVTVAILAYDKREEVRMTLGEVLQLDYPADALHVVVVDNASADGTAAMVAEEFPSVEVIPMERNLGAPAWNRAFARLESEWCLVLDDDCYIGGDALRRAVSAAGAEGADLVSFRVRSSVEPDYYFSDDEPLGLLAFWGCAFLISRRALASTGGYDPNIFMWGNELDLALRLLDAGMSHLFMPEVVAVHMKGPRGADVLGSGRHATIYRHWAYVAVKLLRPLDATRVLARLATAVALDTVAVAPAAARTLPELARGALAGLRVRRPVRAVVSAAARDNVVSFSNPIPFLRPPSERLRVRLGAARDGMGADPAQRVARFRAERARFYPARTASLKL